MADEPTVKRGRIPRGYSLVLKGNVYITANCRKQTQTANQKVYLVANAKDKQIGIAVPSEIHEDVKQKEAETRAARAANVDRRDNAIKEDFEKVILQEFPRLPREDLPKILEQALKKRAGKVGRTGQLSARKKAHLAVRAHIRHCHTPYEELLKGTRRQKGQKAKKHAREMVQGQVNELAIFWAQGRSGQGQPSRPAKTAGMVPSSASPPSPRPKGLIDPKQVPKSVRPKPAGVNRSAPALPRASATSLPEWPDAALLSPQRSVKTSQRIPCDVIDLTIDDEEEDDDEDVDDEWEGEDDDDGDDDDDDDLPDLMVSMSTRNLRGSS